MKFGSARAAIRSPPPLRKCRVTRADPRDHDHFNVYRCNVKSDFGDALQDCFRFTSPGVRSSDFDLDVDQISTTLACDCRAKGALKNVQFGVSTEFHCVAPSNDELTIAFTGQAAGKGSKLKKLQAINDEGDSFLAECVIDPACSVPTLAGGASPYTSR